ncbi:MAG: hypothetical protein KAT90_11065 [Gammaproteobacteria bacterium]|nr:hypothetical protein [Gammaproteobacteria bacterium]
MGKQGTFIAVSDDQEGGSPQLVTKATPLPVKLGDGDLITDAWSIPKVSLPKSLFHGLFTFDIPQSQWFMFENSTQVYVSTNIVSVGGIAVLTADAAKSVALLESRECPRYQPNRGHLFSTALLCPDKTRDGIRQWGVGFVGENGVGFQLRADGLLYAVLLSGGIITHEEVIDTSVLGGFDVEKNNTYDIQYQWRSAGDYFFYIGCPESGVSKLVHRIKLLGTLTGASIQNPALPAHFYAQRTTEDVVMKVGCVDITSENGETDKEVYNSAYADSVTISTDTPVIVIKQPLLINGASNTRTITLARISVKCSKKATFKVWTTRDPANITGATFKALGDGSFVETDSPDMDATAVRATAVVVANLKFITSIPVEALVRVPVDNPHMGRIEFPIVRGDYLIITGTAASGISECVVEFGEQI